MKSGLQSKPSWFNVRVFLLALFFGSLGLLTMWADMRVPIIPAYNIAADVREVFVVLGAAFTGPIGGALVGGLAAAYSPVGDIPLHLASWLAHVAGGFVLGGCYRAVYKFHGWRFLLGWLACVTAFYAALMSILLAGLHLFAPDFMANLAGTGAPPWRGDLIMLISVWPETMMVMVFTAVLMLVLPRHYRHPVGG